MKLFSLLITATLAATAAIQPAAPPSNRLVAKDDAALEGGFVKHCCMAPPSPSPRESNTHTES
jgi:hypothetical protein